MKNLSLNQLVEIILQQAGKKGFGVKPEDINIPEKIALIYSEVSEVYDAYRHNNFDGKDGFSEELADVVIRVLHLAGVQKIDLEQEIIKKINFNDTRKWDWDNMNETHT